jgi:hypothetical protein
MSHYDAINQGTDIWWEYARLLSTHITGGIEVTGVVNGLPTVLLNIIIDYIPMATFPWPHSMSRRVCHALHRSSPVHESPHGVEAPVNHQDHLLLSMWR